MKSWFRQQALTLHICALLASNMLLAQPSSAQSEKSDRLVEHHVVKNNLNVAYIPQERLLGVPTSAAMIMAFYGDAQSPRKLKTMSRGRHYSQTGSFDDFSMTFYRDIVKAAAGLGYDWHEKAFDDSSSGFERGLATIKWEIEHGRPLMIDVSAPDGHTIVVAGFDETTQSVLVVDPNVAAPGRYAISYGQLQSIWNEHAFSRKFRSLVITSPLPYTS